MVLPNPAALDAGVPPKLKALPLAAPLLAPKKVDVEPGVPKAGVDPGVPKAVPLLGAPKALPVPAPNSDVLAGAPNAGVEVAAPNAGVAVAPNMVLPVLAPKAGGALLAPKPGVLAPKGAEAAGVPKAKPPLAGCGRTKTLQAAHQQVGHASTAQPPSCGRLHNRRYHHGMLDVVQEAVHTPGYHRC
jgi:hypothetical protein